MRLLTWTKVLPEGRAFPRDESGEPYLPGSYLEEALKDAVVFYHIKKDRILERTVKRYLMEERLDLLNLARKVYDMVFSRYPILAQVRIPERIPLSRSNVLKVRVEVLDLRRGYDVEDFRTEAFWGALDVPIHLSDDAADRLRYAGRSYVEALAKMEMGMLEEHPLVEDFYQPLLNEMRQWDIPLRLGRWTTAPHGGRLLFFWRIKEVRERILRDYGMDIRPVKVIYLPRDRATAGWSELTRKED
ncbi:MAG: hypothetical protein GXO29_04560 [Thermotogae bacterium]|nr:hypothetical protein [Thermotogota bacterium]